MARPATALYDHDLLAAGSRPPAQQAAPAAAAETAEPLPARLIGDQHWRWIPLLGAWTGVGFLIAFGVSVSNTAQGLNSGVTRGLYATVPHFLAWALVSPALYRALYEFVAGPRRALGASLLAAWGAIAIAASTVFCYLGVALRDGVVPDGAGLMGFVVTPFGQSYQAMNFSILLLALASLGVVLGIRLRARAQWEAAQAELRGARLEAQLNEARFQALQARINPHFLLNSLNAVADLVLKGERDRAFDAIGGLGELLTSALRNGEAPDHSLGDEVDFLQRYLRVCEMRFKSRFRYRLSVPESLRSRRVPALIVQPLIENAIRHGMQPSRPLVVDVRAYEQDTQLVIEVEDNGRGLASGKAVLPAGHGLANVAERLRLCFGAGSGLRLEPRQPLGTRARITIAA
jgi:signal transduction histidine kinase